jgi:hypothetical protein
VRIPIVPDEIMKTPAIRTAVDVADLQHQRTAEL